MIRIAAVGDVHFDRQSAGRLSKHWSHLDGKADMFLIAGDLTQTGHMDEGKVLADDLANCPVPVIAVFGNHDFHMDHELHLRAALEDAGVVLLEQQVTKVSVNGASVGIVGLKGFGGGFVGACASDFGEREMKTFIRHTKSQATFLREALESLDTDYRVALMHYSPIAETLHGEKREIYPFLGSYLLGEAVDAGGADLVIHGHAHRGIERGITPGEVPVRNVAQHVIRHFFNIYALSKEGEITHSLPEMHASSELTF